MADAGKLPRNPKAFTLRRSHEADNKACGLVVAQAAGASAYTARVPFALSYMTDPSPLAIPAPFERIVAETEGRIRGLVQYNPQEGYVKYLFTHPDAQGQGLGSALLRAAEEAIARPTRLTVLWVNDQGLLWYLRRGYRITGGELEADWHGGPVVWIELEKSRP